MPQIDEPLLDLVKDFVVVDSSKNKLLPSPEMLVQEATSYRLKKNLDIQKEYRIDWNSSVSYLAVLKEISEEGSKK